MKQPWKIHKICLKLPWYNCLILCMFKTKRIPFLCFEIITPQSFSDGTQTAQNTFGNPSFL